MATGGGSGEVTLIAHYSGKKLHLCISKNAKVGDIVQKAVESLNLKEKDLPLSLLYQGTPVDDTVPVEVALAKMKGVTAIHLVKRANPGKSSTTKRVISTDEGKLYAYCGMCDGLSHIRPIFQCKECKAENMFERDSVEPLDHFDGNYSPAQVVGTCNQCEGDDIHPNITFQCVACESRDLAILRQIRDNIHNVPCMKCSLRKEMVIQMRCSSRHCLCLDCFTNMCKVKLGNDNFKNFEDFGYSISCPGPGDDCRDVPILDPHHFKIVDADPGKDPAFYKKFKEMSFENYKPSGDDILCLCKKEIAMSSATKVKVAEPSKAEPEPTVSGQKWYSSWLSRFKKKAEASPPPIRTTSKTRRRASCSDCKREYCMECKMMWHTGDCCMVDEKELEDQVFPIPSDQAKSAQWPSSP